MAEKVLPEDPAYRAAAVSEQVLRALCCLSSNRDERLTADVQMEYVSAEIASIALAI
jgi:hypothetical protein